MSVKGFVINGSTSKYDYNNLDNLPSFSLGIDGTDGLAYIYVNGVKQGTGIDVGGGGGSTRYNVTQTLSHASSSNSATKITEGNTYTTTLTADQNYEIKTVIITMGNIPVYGAYDESTGAISIANVSGDIVISNTAEVLPIDLLNVTWANHAITCGQDTNSYNAWSPHNLQYDFENECFVFLQCHANQHIGQTYSNWTLSIIDPYHPTVYENITIPSLNGLGMLFIEDGVWYLLPRWQSYAYRSDDMGETWETLTANIPRYLFGVYKCGDTYFGGNDSNNAITYYKSDDLLSWSEVSFDSSLGYTCLCETTFCEFDGKYWAFNRTNDSTLGHPVILQSSDEGDTWTLFSDQMLHGYRSTVSCYPFQNYIVVADIDRDSGILYYNKFDGEEFTQLDSWQMPNGGDDFHNVNIASNYQDTVILEFMHSVSGYRENTTYLNDKACDNVMLVGSTGTLPSLTFGNYIDTSADMLTYANANLTSGLNGGTYTWDTAYNGEVRLANSNSVTTFIDEIELPLNMIALSSSSYFTEASLKNGDAFTRPWNNSTTNPEMNTGSNEGQTFRRSRQGFVTIDGVRHVYGFGGHDGELPVLTRATNFVELTVNTVGTGYNDMVGESWQEPLGLRRVISVNYHNDGTYLRPFPLRMFTDATSHAIAFMTYTPVPSEVST